MLPHWKPRIIEVPIVVDGSAAYETGELVGGTLVSNEIKQLSGGGYIAWARLVDSTSQSGIYELWFFNAEPSELEDTDPHVPIEADFLKCLGVVDIVAADYVVGGAEGEEVGMVFVVGKDQKTLDYIWFDTLHNGRLYLRLVAGEALDFTDDNGGYPDALTLHLCVLTM